MSWFVVFVGWKLSVTSITFINDFSYIIPMKEKSITIKEDQAEWLEENHFKLSSFVREKLDERIEGGE